MSDLFMPQLEFVLEVRLSLKKPRLEMPALSQGGRRLSVSIVDGSFEGPNLKGKILPGGGEWPHERTDGVLMFDARYHLQEDDGTVILIQNVGYRHASDEVNQRLWALKPGDDVPHDAYYFRAQTRFEVTGGKHEWLAKHVFIGVGRRHETGNIIRYYQVK